MPHWLSSYFCAFNICTITQVYKICTNSTRVYPLSKCPFTHLLLSVVFCTLCDRPATSKGRRMELSGSWFCLCCKSHPQRWGEAERCAECKTPVESAYRPLGGCACRERARADSIDSSVSLTPQPEFQAWHFLDLRSWAVYLTSKRMALGSSFSALFWPYENPWWQCICIGSVSQQLFVMADSFPCPRVFLGQENDPYVFVFFFFFFCS